MTNKICYFKEQSKEWLAFRKTYITGTNVPALFQMSPYQSKNALIKDKIGEPAKHFDSEYLQAGRDLECAVLAKLNRLDYNAKRPHSKKVCVIYNEELGLSASLDAILDNDGKNHLVEIKTTGMEKWKEWLNEGLPLNYIMQVHVQLMLRPFDYEGSALLAAFTPLWPSNPMAVYRIVANDRVQEIIKRAATTFKNDIKGFEYDMPGKEELKTILPTTFALVQVYNYLNKV